MSEASVDILMTLSGAGGVGPKLFCSRLSVRSKTSRFCEICTKWRVSDKISEFEITNRFCYTIYGVQGIFVMCILKVVLRIVISKECYYVVHLDDFVGRRQCWSKAVLQ